MTIIASYRVVITEFFVLIHNCLTMSQRSGQSFKRKSLSTSAIVEPPRTHVRASDSEESQSNTAASRARKKDEDERLRLQTVFDSEVNEGAIESIAEARELATGGRVKKMTPAT